MAAFSLISGLLIPAITSLTSKQTTLSQGVTTGISNSFISLGRIFGPTLGGVVFDVQWGLPFVCGSAVMLVGYLVSLRRIKGTTDLQRANHQLKT